MITLKGDTIDGMSAEGAVASNTGAKHKVFQWWGLLCARPRANVLKNKVWMVGEDLAARWAG